MALVKVIWTEAVRYEAVVDVDEVDADNEDVIEEAISGLRAADRKYVQGDGFRLHRSEVVKGDQEIPKIQAPQWDEDGWGEP